MKQVARKSPPRPRRLGIVEAKTHLSELLRHAASGPTVIHSRGRDVAVVLAVEDYDRLVAQHSVESGGGARFLDRIEALKERHDGGIDDFVPTPVTFQPVNPFPPRAGARR